MKQTSEALPLPLPVRGILFDLDDTLIAYTNAERAALAVGCRLAAASRPEITERAFAAAIYEVYTKSYSYGTPGFAHAGSLSMGEFRRSITEGALLRFGIRDPALTAALVEVYSTAEQNALQTIPGVRETLPLLRPHFRLGIITNGPSAMQRDKLATLALGQWFDLIVVDTEFGHPKPDPRIFDHAADRMGLSPAELLFVGNSLEADVAGARAAGWTSVWAREPHAPDPANLCPKTTPHHTICHFSELLRLPPIAAVLPPATRNATTL